MVQFSIASTTQSTAHSALGPAARLATVVLDAGVPPKKPPSSPSVCPATAHRPQLVQNRPTSRHARAVKFLFWEPQPRTRCQTRSPLGSQSSPASPFRSASMKKCGVLARVIHARLFGFATHRWSSPVPVARPFSRRPGNRSAGARAASKTVSIDACQGYTAPLDRRPLKRGGQNGDRLTVSTRFPRSTET